MYYNNNSEKIICVVIDDRSKLMAIAVRIPSFHTTFTYPYISDECLHSVPKVCLFQ